MSESGGQGPKLVYLIHPWTDDGRLRRIEEFVESVVREVIEEHASNMKATYWLASLAADEIQAASPPLPADSITLVRPVNYAQAGIVLLAVLCWLIIFALPDLMAASRLPSDTQAAADAYDTLVATLAIPVSTG